MIIPLFQRMKLKRLILFFLSVVVFFSLFAQSVTVQTTNFSSQKNNSEKHQLNCKFISTENSFLEQEVEDEIDDLDDLYSFINTFQDFCYLLQDFSGLSQKHAFSRSSTVSKNSNPIWITICQIIR